MRDMSKIMQDHESHESHNRKLIILTFAPYYLPGYRGGGPIRSIANMVERLSDDFQFKIVTRDHDLGDQCIYQGLETASWNPVGSAKVFYASKSLRSLNGIIGLLRETQYDVIYLNSFFDVAFTLRVLIASRFGLVPRKPIVIAPRGEFSIGALKLKKWKKKGFIVLNKIIGLFKHVTWHASTPLESSDIQRVMRGLFVSPKVLVAPNLLAFEKQPLVVETTSSSEKHPDILRICFLSRISPKKNLDFALKVLASINVPVQFNIYGPQESIDYWKLCEELIFKLPKHIQVEYSGAVEPDQVKATIGKHDVFFMPTHGENFGHVFLEAWSAGVPVLISDQTPWRSLDSQQLGYDIPLDQPNAFKEALERIAGWDDAKRSSVKLCCVEFARKNSESLEVLELNKKIFSSFDFMRLSEA